MHEYEIFIEEINPCGGEQYSKKTLIEAEAVSPEAYVKENGRFPVLESTCNESGDVVIVTGDKQGSFVRYTFTDLIISFVWQALCLRRFFYSQEDIWQFHRDTPLSGLP